MLNDTKFSKQAINKALKSEHGDRLMTVVREQVALIREITYRREPGFSGTPTVTQGTTLSVYKERIGQLEAERDAIIQKFAKEGEC